MKKAKKPTPKRKPKGNTVPAGVGCCYSPREEQWAFEAQGPYSKVVQELNALFAEGWLLRGGLTGDACVKEPCIYILYRYKEAK